VGGVDCIRVVRRLDRWRALVNTIMELCVPLETSSVLASERLPVSQGLCRVNL
jgi:hypothetical protein